MLNGNFALAGWYTNIEPGCSVFPITDVSIAQIRRPFGGTIKIEPGSKVTGQIIDSEGEAKIEGIYRDGVLEFRKMYLKGRMAQEPPITYRMLVKIASSDKAPAFTGEYRFEAEQKQASGQVEMTFLADPFPAPVLTGCGG